MNEAFDKWWDEYSINMDCMALESREVIQAAYTAGMERAAEIAETMTIDCPSDKCPQYVDVDDCMYKETGFCIVAAIRKEAGEWQA